MTAFRIGCAAAALPLLLSCSPHTRFAVRLGVDEPDALTAGEPVLLVLSIRNRTAAPLQLDPVGILAGTFELDVRRPSGAWIPIREGIGRHLSGLWPLGIPPGGTVTTYEMFLPDEPGEWVLRARVKLTPQDVSRVSDVLPLPELRIQVSPGIAPRERGSEDFLLGRLAFFDEESDGPDFLRLEAAASPRLLRFARLARAMTTVMSKRWRFGAEDEAARLALEEQANRFPKSPLTDIALQGLIHIYLDLLRCSDPRDARRTADRIRRDHPRSAMIELLEGDERTR